ncbi:periplasmic protein [Vibrio sp. JCM 19236]|nr:periplasmic protein [Vibrio sp. JCM 19236]
MKKELLPLLILSSFAVQADTIFSDDFQSGQFSQWTISGSGATAYANLYAGNYSLRLRNQKAATQQISTKGYSGVSVTTSIAAANLVRNAQCITEVSTDGGMNWQSTNTVTRGQDDGVTMHTSSMSPNNIDDNINVQIRLKSQGSSNSNYCYFDDVLVEGNPISEGEPVRNELTYQTMQTQGNGSLVDLSAFSMPENSMPPTQHFEGTLSFSSVQRGFEAIYDPHLYGNILGAKKLPDFNYQFVQSGEHLIPVTRGLIETNHNLWQLILEPGKVWDESTDQGFSRAAIPFALQEAGANCTHNGVLSFLYRSDGSISSVAYQISSETCAYNQFNMYGLLSATYIPSSIPQSEGIQNNFVSELSNRIPVKPIQELAVDFPNSGIDVAKIASQQTSTHLTSFGVSYNGVHYAGGCETRSGTYPYCDVMSLPSYSVAKSTHGAYGLMLLEQMSQGVKVVT